MTGTILRLFRDKGFGFIRGDDGQEYFVHVGSFVEYHGLDHALPDMRVEFEEAPSEGRGLRARAVRVLV